MFAELDVYFMIVPFYMISFSITVVGTYLVTHATIHVKSLQNASSYLRLASAIFSLLFEFGNAFMMVHIVLGDRSMPSTTCFMVQVVPLYSVNASICYLISTAMDRFLVVAYVNSSKSIKRTQYVIFFIGPNIYSAAIMIVGFAFGWKKIEEEIVPVCAVFVAYTGKARTILHVASVAMGLINSTVYMGLYIALRRRRITDRAVLKSMLSMACLFFFGWTTTWVLLIASYHLITGKYSLLGSLFAFFLMSFCNSMRFLLYYKNNQDYRAHFRKVFGLAPENRSLSDATTRFPARSTTHSNVVKF